ncbi:hypothetical protein COTS27_00026 [Spirochaetota bacterium]|nr:hypothetical protein COTS27_00026 [Spirochaetota bacterium]
MILLGNKNYIKNCTQSCTEHGFQSQWWVRKFESFVAAIGSIFRWNSRNSRFRLLIPLVLAILVVPPAILHGQVYFKVETKTNVVLKLRVVPEMKQRYELVITEVPTSVSNDATSFTMPSEVRTKFFYDEVAVIRKIEVVEQKTSPVWNEADSQVRMEITFYETGILQKITEKLAWVGGRTLYFDRLGRIADKRLFFYESERSHPSYRYTIGRTFREVYTYSETDVIIERRLYKNGSLHAVQTQTLPIETGAGTAFRINYINKNGDLVRYEEVLRTTPTPTGIREMKTVYSANGTRLTQQEIYYRSGKLSYVKIDNHQEITYAYDTAGRLIQKKHEHLANRNIARYYDYAYYSLAGINRPSFWGALTEYSIEDLRHYGERGPHTWLDQYRLLRVNGWIPVKMTTYTSRERTSNMTTTAPSPIKKRSVIAQKPASTRLERHFLPTRLFSLHFENNVLTEKHVSTMQGIPLGSYQYVYDDNGRLYESIFTENSAVASRRSTAPSTTTPHIYPKTKKVRYLYSDQLTLPATVTSAKIPAYHGNWEYFGHSLFSYLAKQERSLRMRTLQELVSEFEKFKEYRTDPTAVPSDAATKLIADQVYANFLYITKSKLARVLYIDEQEKVMYYIKFVTLPLPNGKKRLLIRYYRGEPDFFYNAAFSKLPAARGEVLASSDGLQLDRGNNERNERKDRLAGELNKDGQVNPGRQAGLRGERNAFLTDGTAVINTAYPEDLIVEFAFDYDEYLSATPSPATPRLEPSNKNNRPASLINRNSRTQLSDVFPYKKELRMLARRRTYTQHGVLNEERTINPNETIGEYIQRERLSKSERNARRYEEDFVKNILPSLK